MGDVESEKTELSQNESLDSIRRYILEQQLRRLPSQLVANLWGEAIKEIGLPDLLTSGFQFSSESVLIREIRQFLREQPVLYELDLLQSNRGEISSAFNRGLLVRVIDCSGVGCIRKTVLPYEATSLVDSERVIINPERFLICAYAAGIDSSTSRQSAINQSKVQPWGNESVIIEYYTGEGIIRMNTVEKFASNLVQVCEDMLIK